MILSDLPKFMSSNANANVNASHANNTDTDKKLVIGIVAGEVSGDKLGAVLMRQMQAFYPNIEWVGVGGQQMQAQGLIGLFDMSRLSVMGLIEVIRHLPDLLKAKNTLLSAFKTANIDMFIGIDAPDFNLRLGKVLKSQCQPKSVFCVQYVSPSIWAWREGRIKGIKQATDLVLCLFPFELGVYQRHQHSAVCVGHPLLDEIQPRHTQSDRQLAINRLCNLNYRNLAYQLKQRLISQAHVAILCVMPGSRVGEITAIFPKMLMALSQLLKLKSKSKFKSKSLSQQTDFVVLIPTMDRHHVKLIKQLIFEYDESLQAVCHVLFEPGEQNLSHQAMLASDVVVLASGTATFEAMLLQRPMVVVYQLNALTYQIAKRLIKVPYVALPNILANRRIVPEFIQNAATPSAIAQAVQKQLLPNINQQQQKALQALSDKVRQDSHHNAAQTVLRYYFKA